MKYFNDYIKESNNNTSVFEDFIFERSNIEDIKGKYYSEIPLDVFKSLIMSDPTTIIDDNDKPIKMGKYSKWILDLYIKNPDDTRDEDLYKFKENLSLFNKLKNSNVLKRDNINADINSYKNLPDLSKTLRDYKEKDESNLSKRELEKMIKNNEAVVFWENEKCKVIIPKSERASCYYGKNTEWCTASTSSHNHFDDYNSRGSLYIIIDKDNSDIKYQFHVQSNEFMNVNNGALDSYDISKTLKYYDLHQQFIEDVLEEEDLDILEKYDGVIRLFGWDVYLSIDSYEDLIVFFEENLGFDDTPLRILSGDGIPISVSFNDISHLVVDTYSVEDFIESLEDKYDADFENLKNLYGGITLHDIFIALNQDGLEDVSVSHLDREFRDEVMSQYNDILEDLAKDVLLEDIIVQINETLDFHLVPGEFGSVSTDLDLSNLFGLFIMDSEFLQVYYKNKNDNEIIDMCDVDIDMIISELNL